MSSASREAVGDRVGREQRVGGLVQELYRQALALAAEITARSGLHTTDVQALRVLDGAADGPLPVNTLGAQLGLSSGAVTALVDRLEAHGLAHRQRDPGDRRKVLVALAPTAAAFGAEHLRPIQARLRAATSALDDSQLAAVESFLTDLLSEPSGH